MSIKLVPITQYEFDMLNLFVKAHYGKSIAINPAKFDVDEQDVENPKCGNCKNIIRNVYRNKDNNSFCAYCGAKLVWKERNEPD